MLGEAFIELAIVLVVAVIVSAIMRAIKQPLIIGHIATGIIVSPILLNVIQTKDAFPAFAQMGVSILLFMVGLHLNPKAIKDVGKIALITGLGQIIFTSGAGFLIARALGFAVIPAIYMAIALTFSSTIIILKLLSDKGDMETLYGRIAIGFLIVQDIVAMLILMIISSSASTAGGVSLILFVEITIKLIAILVVVYIIAKAVFPLISEKIAKSQEFLLFFAIAWCFIVATIFALLDFSIEAGALLAGVALSMSPLKYEISSKLKPLRDFFILLFFVWLGSQMVFTDIAQYAVPVIVLSLFVLIGNPLIVLILMGFFGYSKRNSLFAGFTVAQISEFSLILIGLGVAVGHLTGEILSLVTFIGLLTIAGSTYMIIYNKKIYEFLSPYLSVFERKKKVDEQELNTHNNEVVLFGYNRVGFDLAESFTKMKTQYLVIDNNSETIKELRKQGLRVLYGDADNREFLKEINFSKTKLVVSTIPDIETNFVLIKELNEIKPGTIVIVIANQIEEALELYEAGASYVLMPHMLGGMHTAEMIQKLGFNSKKFLKEKQIHLKHIERRQNYKKLTEKTK